MTPIFSNTLTLDERRNRLNAILDRTEELRERLEAYDQRHRNSKPFSGIYERFDIYPTN